MRMPKPAFSPETQARARAPRAVRTIQALRLLQAMQGCALLLCGLLPALSACSAPSGEGAPADESVKPGINQPFLDPALKVDEFVTAFEGESREIAKNRAGIVAALGALRGMSVADVGAGTGLFMEPLAEAVGPHGRLLALEISPPFLAHLRQRAAELKLPQVQVRACTERSIDLPDSSLDLAFVCDTYHHFEHPQETLASLRSALRPGGKLVIVDFERIEGHSRDWVLKHMRLGKQATRAEIERAGFHFLGEVQVQGLHENYLLRFERP